MASHPSSSSSADFPATSLVSNPQRLQGAPSRQAGPHSVSRRSGSSPTAVTTMFPPNIQQQRPTKGPEKRKKDNLKRASSPLAIPALGIAPGSTQTSPYRAQYSPMTRERETERTVSKKDRSKYLITVIPPLHLPHDPPHPRTSPFSSGYGSTTGFRRGTLVPLYPTLSLQLAAIAREYSLPSTGGLLLFLLSTTPALASPFSSALSSDGGPRIGGRA
ncbi:hypothetical protein BT69DRAFT_984665 [Atractiella rhizophila]|nr:hypothetical protein BT69DRAFT_984665 [Atractiella rhizophila]